MIAVDKKSYGILRYIYTSKERSFEEIEQAIGMSVLDSMELRKLEEDGYIYNSSRIRVSGNKDMDFFSVTPKGREAFENYSRERWRDVLLVATFIVALLSLILNGYRYL